MKKEYEKISSNVIGDIAVNNFVSQKISVHFFNVAQKALVRFKKHAVVTKTTTTLLNPKNINRNNHLNSINLFVSHSYMFLEPN